MSRLIDLTGERRGNWTVVAMDRSDRRGAWWRVRCNCGREAVVRGDSLRSGGTHRCGDCSRKATGAANATHGGSRTPTWRAWRSMRDRCNNPSAAGYQHYGGRGISYDPAWEDYARFAADMGERPSPQHSLDRIDVDAGYSAENCRWATITRQARNRRRTVWIEANGKRQSLSDWAEELGVRHVTLDKRYRAGWSDAEIVGVPVLKPQQRRAHIAPVG